MKKNTKLIALFISASVVGSAVTLMATSALQNKGLMGDVYVPSQQTQEQSFVRTTAYPASVESDFTRAAESTINSVVSIKSYATPRQQQYFGGDEFFDPFEFFFGQGNGSSRRRQQQPKESNPQPSGLGSGVIISSDGYIVTNNHVIDGAEKLEVTLNDNRQFTATVVGTDANSDIALIKIPAKDLKAITFGSSDKIKVGEWVLAVGNPFGFNSTVTAGIISAKARGLNKGNNVGIESFIQHDAAVNPGNSGGALVNINGELVGINTLIYSNTGNYAGYSFAIPSDVVQKIVTDIKQYGTVQRAVLGIQFTELTAEKAKDKEITATSEGVYVEKVTDRSAAKEAGIKECDVIVKLNDSNIKNGAQLLEQMSKQRPGDTITIGYYRDNNYRTTKVTLKNDQGTTKISKGSDFLSLGCAFTPLSKDEKENLGVEAGVKVTGLKDGKFKRAGIKDGFVITAIDGNPVSSQDDVEEIYNAIMRDKSKDKVMLITGYTSTGKKEYRAVALSDED